MLHWKNILYGHRLYLNFWSSNNNSKIKSSHVESLYLNSLPKCIASVQCISIRDWQRGCTLYNVYGRNVCDQQHYEHRHLPVDHVLLRGNHSPIQSGPIPQKAFLNLGENKWFIVVEPLMGMGINPLIHLEKKHSYHQRRKWGGVCNPAPNLTGLTTWNKTKEHD